MLKQLKLTDWRGIRAEDLARIGGQKERAAAWSTERVGMLSVRRYLSDTEKRQKTKVNYRDRKETHRACAHEMALNGRSENVILSQAVKMNQCDIFKDRLNFDMIKDSCIALSMCHTAVWHSDPIC